MATLRYWDVTANAYLPVPALNAPPSGPAGGDLRGNYPSPTVSMNVPGSLASGAPFTAFTDSIGTVWVAKGGVNGGIWKKATDVIASKYYRNTAWTLTITVTILPFDTVVNDPYGLYSPSTGIFTVPVAGLYRVGAVIMGLATASGNWIGSGVRVNGMPQQVSQGWTSGTAQGTTSTLNDLLLCNTNDQIEFTCNASASYAGQTGLQFTNCNIKYEGTN